MSRAMYTREELITEYQWTWPRHHGVISVAAEILGMTPSALARALSRAKRDGALVEFVDDHNRKQCAA